MTKVIWIFDDPSPLGYLSCCVVLVVSVLKPIQDCAIIRQGMILEYLGSYSHQSSCFLGRVQYRTPTLQGACCFQNALKPYADTEDCGLSLRN